MPFYVYVIELDPEVKKSRKFLERNAIMLPYGQCFYVGQSVHEPDCRYRQHKECPGDEIRVSCICYRRPGRFTKNPSNYFARKFGKSLARARYESLNPIPTRKAAEAMEE